MGSFWLMRFSTGDGRTATGIWVLAVSAEDAMATADAFDVKLHPEYKPGYYVRHGVGHKTDCPDSGTFLYESGRVIRFERSE